MNILGQNLLEFAHRGEGRRGGRDLQDSRLAYEDKALGCKVQGEVSLLEMTDNDRAAQDLPMPVRMPKDDRVAVCQRPEGHAPFLHDSEVDQGVDQIGAPEVAAGLREAVGQAGVGYLRLRHARERDPGPIRLVVQLHHVAVFAVTEGGVVKSVFGAALKPIPLLTSRARDTPGARLLHCLDLPVDFGLSVSSPFLRLFDLDLLSHFIDIKGEVDSAHMRQGIVPQV